MEFLRTRRARLSPAEVGLPSGLRRRAPGLRREDIAQLAGVGITWYTWFEQGRDIQVSMHFLENLATALRLDDAERAHLFALAQHRLPPLGPVQTALVSPIVQRVLNAHPYPIYVRTRRWDVVGWNRAATIMFGDYASMPAEERNVLWLVFTSPEYKRLMIDWETGACRVLARFRVDAGRAGGDAGFTRLIETLERASEQFRHWWQRHDVFGQGEGLHRFHHEQTGLIEFEHAAFVIDGSENLKAVAFTPGPGESEAKARSLFGLAPRPCDFRT